MSPEEHLIDSVTERDMQVKSKLPTAAKRRRLAKEGKAEKTSTFGREGPGGYPTDTPGRARAAKGRATQAVKSGRMSAGRAARIKARANRELGKSKKGAAS